MGVIEGSGKVTAFYCSIDRLSKPPFFNSTSHVQPPPVWHFLGVTEGEPAPSSTVATSAPDSVAAFSTLSPASEMSNHLLSIFQKMIEISHLLWSLHILPVIAGLDILLILYYILNRVLRKIENR